MANKVEEVEQNGKEKEKKKKIEPGQCLDALDIDRTALQVTGIQKTHCPSTALPTTLCMPPATLFVQLLAGLAFGETGQVAHALG